MEKLCYAVRRREAEDRRDFNARLLGPVRTELMRLSVQRLKIGVQDEALAPGDALYPEARHDAPDALVSFWLDSAYARAPMQAVLAGSGGWMAGYQVLESTVLPVRRASDDGSRDKGFTQIAFFRTLGSLSRDEALSIWLDDHTAVAVGTQSTFQYRQNVVVRALTPDAPAWDCIVEETFPLTALSDPQVYFDGVGSEETVKANHERLMQSCARFIDFATMKLLLCSDYKFGGWSDGLPGFVENHSPPDSRT